MEYLLSLAAGGANPWPKTRAALVSVLLCLDRLSDRVALVDRLGSHPLPPLQYVDALTVVCPSMGALISAVGPGPESACGRYALRAKAAFNYKPGKSAAMAMCGTPVVQIRLDFVQSHRIWEY